MAIGAHVVGGLAVVIIFFKSHLRFIFDLFLNLGITFIVWVLAQWGFSSEVLLAHHAQIWHICFNLIKKLPVELLSAFLARQQVAEVLAIFEYLRLDRVCEFFETDIVEGDLLDLVDKLRDLRVVAFADLLALLRLSAILMIDLEYFGRGLAHLSSLIIILLETRSSNLLDIRVEIAILVKLAILKCKLLFLGRLG